MHAIVDKDEMRVGELVENGRDSFAVRSSSVKSWTVRKGFGVDVSLVYRGENDEGLDPDEEVAFDTLIVPIDTDACRMIAGVPCVEIGKNAYVPVENFGDAEESTQWDSAYFETEDEAKKYESQVSTALSRAGLESY